MRRRLVVATCWSLIALCSLSWAATWPRIILVTPPPPDTQAPSLSIKAPVPGAVVARNSTVLITVVAADNMSITRLAITVSGQSLCILFAEPYQCPWQVPARANQAYTINAQAMDQSGNNAMTQIAVTSN